jgi:D-psicose/D-tagatose/L-ribulose 3-epimerase
VNFPALRDALVEIGYDDLITFEPFSSEVVDKADNVKRADEAEAFVEARRAVARREARAVGAG